MTYVKITVTYTALQSCIYEINTVRCIHTLPSHHFINTICHSTMFQEVILIHSNSKVTRMRHLSVRMYQVHSLKLVGVTYSVNAVIT